MSLYSRVYVSLSPQTQKLRRTGVSPVPTVTKNVAHFLYERIANAIFRIKRIADTIFRIKRIADVFFQTK